MGQSMAKQWNKEGFILGKNIACVYGYVTITLVNIRFPSKIHKLSTSNFTFATALKTTAWSWKQLCINNAPPFLSPLLFLNYPSVLSELFQGRLSKSFCLLKIWRLLYRESQAKLSRQSYCSYSSVDLLFHWNWESWSGVKYYKPLRTPVAQFKCRFTQTSVETTGKNYQLESDKHTGRMWTQTPSKSSSFYAQELQNWRVFRKQRKINNIRWFKC